MIAIEMRSFLLVSHARTLASTAFSQPVIYRLPRKSAVFYSTSASHPVSPLDDKEDLSIFNRIKWKQLLEDDTVIENIKRRQETANVDKLRQMWRQLKDQDQVRNLGPSDGRSQLEEALVTEALRFPNDTHQAAIDCGDKPKLLRVIGQPCPIAKPKDFQELCESRGYLKRTNLGDLVGSRPYVLKGYLAELEQALINYTVEALKNEGFEFISVPDFLSPHVIESCGFPVKSERTMVYEIKTEEGEQPFYLSGTSEMGIAGYLENRTFEATELPLKLAAVSRCFRAEISTMEEERGIFRVHNFSKVEMFCVTKGEGTASEELHDYICALEEKLFTGLDLHYQVMEMSPNDLGSPAYRKFDIEAWMPGRKQFGEISSCSNCTDYQSRRLNIRYKDGPKADPKFVHTLNGTACAIPRMLIAVIESCQTEHGDMLLPDVLQKHMHSKWIVNPPKSQAPTFLKSRGHQDKILLHYDPWRE